MKATREFFEELEREISEGKLLVERNDKAINNAVDESSLLAQLGEKEARIKELTDQYNALVEKEAWEKSLNNKLSKKIKTEEKLNKEIQEKDKEIEELKDKIDALQKQIDAGCHTIKIEKMDEEAFGKEIVNKLIQEMVKEAKGWKQESREELNSAILNSCSDQLTKETLKIVKGLKKADKHEPSITNNFHDKVTFESESTMNGNVNK